MVDPLYISAPKALRWFNFTKSLPKTAFSSLKIILGLTRSKSKKPYTIFTFTTSERFARVWYHFVCRVLSIDKWNIVIGDSSGSIRPSLFPNAEVFKIYNFTHGKKIDIFLKNVIQSPLVFLCDDDVYLTKDITPIITELEKENVGAISLKPRTWYKWQIDGKEYKPMGSYALLINKKLIGKLNLSFMPLKNISANKKFPENTKSQPNYDTADYINEFFLENNYEVPILADEEFTLGFDGMTTPTILLQNRGIEYIRQALAEAKHFKPGSLNGAQIRGLYCLASFEEIYAKLFSDIHKYEYLSIEELKKFNRPEIGDYFERIDSIKLRLLR